jgi:hypothetical protein
LFYQVQYEGKVMRPGQVLQYVITDYYNRKNAKKREHSRIARSIK